MHCLPVYRGKEASADVVDGPQSVIWQEAENRLHAQKAIMAFVLAYKQAGQNNYFVVRVVIMSSMNGVLPL